MYYLFEGQGEKRGTEGQFYDLLKDEEQRWETGRYNV